MNTPDLNIIKDMIPYHRAIRLIYPPYARTFFGHTSYYGKAMEDRCVICGAIVPEGRMVCPDCEAFYLRNDDYCSN